MQYFYCTSSWGSYFHLKTDECSRTSYRMERATHVCANCGTMPTPWYDRCLGCTLQALAAVIKSKYRSR